MDPILLILILAVAGCIICAIWVAFLSDTRNSEEADAKRKQQSGNATSWTFVGGAGDGGGCGGGGDGGGGGG